MTAPARLFDLGQTVAHRLRLPGVFSVEQCVLVETDHPPPATRGLKDLSIRVATAPDVTALAALDERNPEQFERRLARGDVIYLGELEREVVCATCFHVGPAPFDEEQTLYARWRLGDAATYWSYDAMARTEVRSLGVVAKLFEVALGQLFRERGARRIRGFIHHWNAPSRMLHERLGFRTLGTLTAIGIPGLKWLRWNDGGSRRTWLVPRGSPLAFPP